MDQVNVVNMEKGVNLCDFGDILLHAESIGYGWNEAHEILDDYYPYHGTTHVYRDDVEEDTNLAAREILNLKEDENNYSRRKRLYRL